MFWDSAIAGISNVVGKFVEDKDKRNELEKEIKQVLLSNEAKLKSYQRDIIVAETQSGSFLAQNWRPIMMLSFVGIIVNNYMVAPYLEAFGFTFVVMEIPEDMWTLLHLGVTGYIAGRTIEKASAEVAKIVKK